MQHGRLSRISVLAGRDSGRCERLRLRVKDVDFSRSEITVRDGKAGERPRDDVARVDQDPAS